MRRCNATAPSFLVTFRWKATLPTDERWSPADPEEWSPSPEWVAFTIGTVALREGLGPLHAAGVRRDGLDTHRERRPEKAFWRSARPPSWGLAPLAAGLWYGPNGTIRRGWSFQYGQRSNCAILAHLQIPNMEVLPAGPGQKTWGFVYAEEPDMR
jgi:hypothetical protein